MLVPDLSPGYSMIDSNETSSNDRASIETKLAEGSRLVMGRGG